MMQVSILVCALGLIGSTAGQIIQLGTCSSNVTVVEDFDVDQYLGLWRQIEAYPAFFQTGSCVNATYTLNSDGDVDVYNTEVVLGALSSINGTAALATDDGSAKLDVTFTILDLFNVTSNYWVLATDYTSYALVYSCAEVTSSTRAVFSWKLSRNDTLTDDANSVIDSVITTTDGLSQTYYVTTDRSESACTYS